MITMGVFSMAGGLNILVAFCTLTAPLVATLSNGTNDEEETCNRGCLLNKLFADYDQGDMPQEDKATVVRVGLYIRDLYAVSEVTMDYSIKCYLRQEWYDPRLQFANKGITSRISEILLSAKDIKDKLWLPDTVFREEKGAKSLHPDNIINSDTLGKVRSTGRVWYVRELTVNLKCPMQLQKYPLDEQVCDITVESFRMRANQLFLVWLDKAVGAETHNMHLGSFTFKDFSSSNCSQTFSNGISFPCLNLRLHLERQIGYYLMQLYLPSMLVVMLSWLTFWIDMDAGNQINMQLLLILTITTMNYGAQSDLPKVSYVKALDVWFLGCLVFVCVTLLESSIVSCLAWYSPQDTSQLLQVKPEFVFSNKESDGATREELEQMGTAKKPTTKIPPMHKIHRISRVLFPAVFALFNAIYWWFYLH